MAAWTRSVGNHIYMQCEVDVWKSGATQHAVYPRFYLWVDAKSWYWYAKGPNSTTWHCNGSEKSTSVGGVYLNTSSGSSANNSNVGESNKLWVDSIRDGNQFYVNHSEAVTVWVQATFWSNLSQFNGIWAGGNLTLEALTTACSAPTNFRITSGAGRIVPGQSITLAWDGGYGGTANAFTKYYIQRSVNGGAWTDGVGVIWNPTSRSITIPYTQLGLSRGNSITFRIRTEGAAGSSFYSGFTSSSNSTVVNTLPTCSISSVSRSILPYGGGTATINVSASGYGTLKYYVVDGSSYLVSSSFTRTYTFSGATKTINVYVMDGMGETSSYASTTFTRNTKPTFSSCTVNRTLVPKAGGAVQISGSINTNNSGQTATWYYEVNTSGTWDSNYSSSASPPSVNISMGTAGQTKYLLVRGWDGLDWTDETKSFTIKANTPPTFVSGSTTPYGISGNDSENMVFSARNVTTTGSSLNNLSLKFKVYKNIYNNIGEGAVTTIYVGEQNNGGTLTENGFNNTNEGQYFSYHTYIVDSLGDQSGPFSINRTDISSPYYRANSKPVAPSSAEIKNDKNEDILTAGIFETKLTLLITGVKFLSDIVSAKIEYATSDTSTGNFANWTSLSTLSYNTSNIANGEVTVNIPRGTYLKIRIKTIDKLNYESPYFTSPIILRRNLAPVFPSNAITVNPEVKPFTQSLSLVCDRGSSDDDADARMNSFNVTFRVEYAPDLYIDYSSQTITSGFADNRLEWSLSQTELLSTFSPLTNQQKNTTYTMMITVIGRDTFGIETTTSKSITVNFKENPVMPTESTNLYTMKAFFNHNTSKDILPSEYQMMNPGEKIKFIFPEATDLNGADDVRTYVIKSYSTTKENSITETDLSKYKNLVVFSANDPDNYIYEIPFYDVNTIVKFAVYAIDSTSLESNSVLFSGGIEICRRAEQPSIKLNTVTFHQSIEDNRQIDLTFNITDIGGSIIDPARITSSGTPMTYKDRRNFERQITGYSKAMKITLVCSKTSTFDESISGNVTKIIIYNNTGEEDYNIDLSQITTSVSVYSKQSYYTKLLIEVNTDLIFSDEGTPIIRKIYGESNVIYLVGTSPLVAYRKGAVGINSDSFEDDTALILSSTNNTRMVILEGHETEGRIRAYYNLDTRELYEAVVNITDNDYFTVTLNINLNQEESSLPLTPDMNPIIVFTGTNTDRHEIDFFDESGTLQTNKEFSLQFMSQVYSISYYDSKKGVASEQISSIKFSPCFSDTNFTIPIKASIFA